MVYVKLYNFTVVLLFTNNVMENKCFVGGKLFQHGSYISFTI